MQNVRTEVNGADLVITVDLSNTGTRSASGKNIVIASTRGNVRVDTPDGPVTLGLNLYRSPN